MNFKLSSFTIRIFLMLVSHSQAQTIFDSKEEVVQYLVGEWNLDVVSGGFAGGTYFLPSPYFYDSTSHKVIFEATQIDSTPLICKAFIDDTLYQERYIRIEQNPSQIILPRWLVFNLPENLGGDVSVMESIGFYGFSQDTIVLSQYFPDGFDYGYTKLVSGNGNVTQEPDIVIYPNPTKNRLFVRGILPGTPFEIYNANGTFMRRGLMNDQSISLPLMKGTYIVRLLINGKWYAKKIVKMTKS